MELPTNKIISGDCLEVMKTFPDESIDLIATDPPYGYSFMGKDWDKAVPSVEVWKECLRVLKSGGFMFVMSAPRQDVLSQMIVRLGQAGFETGFTSIYWAYASGFPKAMNVSLAVDKQECRKQLREKLGREPTKDEFNEAWKTFREVIGKKECGYQVDISKTRKEQGYRPNETCATKEVDITIPESEQAKSLDGSYGGFQPKPAVEIIIVCMKPLSEKTYVEQALKNGKGVTWLDDCRIPHGESMKYTERTPRVDENIFSDKSCGFKKEVNHVASASVKGRFPANLLVSDDVLNDGKITTSEGGKTTRLKESKTEEWGYKEFHMQGYGDSGSFSRYFDLDQWWLKTVENLPESVKKTFPFLICPKASKRERDKGCEQLEPKRKSEITSQNMENALTGSGNVRNPLHRNNHPTVKPLKLMSYLVTLGSREGDVVLDPFVGSGTTCLASEILNRRWIGIEISPGYVEIARKRLGSIPNTLTTFF